MVSHSLFKTKKKTKKGNKMNIKINFPCCIIIFFSDKYMRFCFASWLMLTSSLLGFFFFCLLAYELFSLRYFSIWTIHTNQHEYISYIKTYKVKFHKTYCLQ